MHTEVITSEERYTLYQAREIIARERRQRKAVFKQKIIGLCLLAISATEVICGYAGLIDEGGAFIFALLLGLYFIFTREI